MDLGTVNAAQVLHTERARQLERELEYRRIATARAAEQKSALMSSGVTVPARRPGPIGVLALLIRRSRATAH